MKIKENLYYVSGGLYGQLGNVYAMKHAHGYILIDCGTPSAYDQIVKNLKYWHIDECDITHVLLTHGHDDHAGTAYAFQRLGAKIIIGSEDQYMLQQGHFGKESPYQNHQMPACKADIQITEDTHITINDLEIDIIKMPGHTNGTLLYYISVEDDNILFTGDMFYSDGEKGDLAFTGWKGDLNYNSKLLGESFSKLWNLALSPTILLGGHGNPRIGEGAKDTIMHAYKYYLTNNR